MQKRQAPILRAKGKNPMVWVTRMLVACGLPVFRLAQVQPSPCALLATGHDEFAIYREGNASMKQLSASDTLFLSLPERIQLVEDIWDTIAIQGDAIELTDQEKRLIDERLESYRQNPGEGSRWEDVHKQILSRRK